jgi:hypothetical protein
MGALKTAAKKKKGELAQKVKARPNDLALRHPVEDSPAAKVRAEQPYIPPLPEKRFDFLKTFATIPGLRSKGTPGGNQGQ